MMTAWKRETIPAKRRNPNRNEIELTTVPTPRVNSNFNAQLKAFWQQASAATKAAPLNGILEAASSKRNHMLTARGPTQK